MKTNYKFIKKNENVFFIEDEKYNINKIGNDLEKYCLENNLLKARVCLHQKYEDKIQKMIVFHSKKYQVPIHKHQSKDETFIVLKGSCIYREYCAVDVESKLKSPQITFEIPLNPLDAINIKSRKWHNLKILSDIVFFEVTLGPFTSESTTFSKIE